MNILRIIIISCLAFVIVTLHSCVPNGNGDAQVALIKNLGLLEGHLKIGEELLNKGSPLLAEPHFKHPKTELFSKLEKLLEDWENFENFKQDLEELEKNVKLTPSDPKIEDELENIYDQINKIVEKQEIKPKLKAILAIMEEGKDKYTEAVKKTSITGSTKYEVIELLEYHDVRGFTESAQKLFNSISGKLDQESSDIADSLNIIQENLPLYPPEFVEKDSYGYAGQTHTFLNI